MTTTTYNHPENKAVGDRLGRREQVFCRFTELKFPVLLQSALEEFDVLTSDGLEDAHDAIAEQLEDEWIAIEMDLADAAQEALLVNAAIAGKENPFDGADLIEEFLASPNFQRIATAILSFPTKGKTMTTKITTEEAIAALSAVGIDAPDLKVSPDGLRFYANDPDGNEYLCRAATCRDLHGQGRVAFWEYFNGPQTHAFDSLDDLLAGLGGATCRATLAGSYTIITPAEQHDNIAADRVPSATNAGVDQ